MSLRVKLAVSMVALAAGATLTVGVASYLSTRHELRSQVDASLRDAAARTAADRDGGPPFGPPGRQGSFGGADESADSGDGGVVPLPRTFTQITLQAIRADGTVIAGSVELPVRARDLDIAADRSRSRRVFANVQVDGEDYRVLTVSRSWGALQLARSLEETNRTLRHIRVRTVLTILVMSAVALLLGLLIAQQVTRRLVRLTRAATDVERSGDLDVQVPVEGRDETGRLGAAFNGMLASLARSRRAQHELVQDAGHELRTPLTSLRTNVAVMRRFAELSPTSQQRLLDDLDSETRELSDLVDELVELATDRRDDEVPVELRLGDTARAVIDRAVRRSGRAITLEADGSVALVRPQALERAMSNVVGNAIKFSDGEISVSVRDGRFTVDDRGPGISDADRERIFDRFYRAVGSRSLPGSGLGLAIVREVAESHGGSVFALARPGGGSSIGFALPVVSNP